jgi:hypothetical protein
MDSDTSSNPIADSVSQSLSDAEESVRKNSSPIRSPASEVRSEVRHFVLKIFPQQNSPSANEYVYRWY